MIPLEAVVAYVIVRQVLMSMNHNLITFNKDQANEDKRTSYVNQGASGTNSAPPLPPHRRLSSYLSKFIYTRKRQNVLFTKYKEFALYLLLLSKDLKPRVIKR